MGSHRAPRRSFGRRLRSARLRAALGLGVVVGFGAISTSAYWTDQATVSGGSFTAGRLDIKVGDPAVDNDPAAFTTAFALSNMVPGSSKDAALKVTNSGSVAFTFTVTGSATNSGAGTDQMGSALRIAVYPSSNAGACTGTAIVSNVAPNAVSIARPALNPSAATDLCFRATLPTDASAALQGQTTKVTFTLLATQVP